MKKYFLKAAVVLFGVSFMTSCKGNKKATDQEVLKYLPGTWKLAEEVDDEGEITTVKQDILLTFGKEGENVPEGQGSTSSIAGKFSMQVDGKTMVTNGRWNIEYDYDDPGVLLYCHNDYGQIITFPDGESFFFIVTINSSKMKVITDEYSDEGYILHRVVK